nr:glutathione S-transferase T3-like isoform X2 [Tanacetum cinerariifolium]
MGYGLGHGSAHGLALVNDDVKDDSLVEGVSPVKPKKPSRRATRAKKDAPKEPPKDWTVAEKTALCQAWCDMSENNITGNNMKISGFWDAVITYFEKKLVQQEVMTQLLANEKIGFPLELVLFASSSIMLKRITKVNIFSQGQDYNYNQDYSMGYGLGHGSAHGLALVNDDVKDDSPVEGVSPVKPKKPSRRATRAKKDALKEPPKDWTVAEKTALCQAWCDMSENNITGNNMKISGFWDAVITYFEKKLVQQEVMTQLLANEKIGFPLELVLFASSSIMLKRITKVRRKKSKTSETTLGSASGGIDLNDEADEESEEL